MPYDHNKPCIPNDDCPLAVDGEKCTHHCLLYVNFLTTGQAEVCYFCHKVITYENIPGCQIPVDKLMSREQRITREAVLSDISIVGRLNSTFDTQIDSINNYESRVNCRRVLILPVCHWDNAFLLPRQQRTAAAAERSAWKRCHAPWQRQGQSPTPDSSSGSRGGFRMEHIRWLCTGNLDDTEEEKWFILHLHSSTWAIVTQTPIRPHPLIATSLVFINTLKITN